MIFNFLSWQTHSKRCSLLPSVWVFVSHSHRYHTPRMLALVTPHVLSVCQPFTSMFTACMLLCCHRFWATLAGCVGGVGFGLLAEKGMQGRMKTLLVLLCVLSFLSYLWFALVCSKWITHNKSDVTIMLCESSTSSLLLATMILFDLLCGFPSWYCS